MSIAMPKIVQKDLKTHFRELRRNQGLTVKELITKFDLKGYIIDRVTISKYELEENSYYSPYILQAYRDVFDVSTDYLLGFSQRSEKYE